MKKRSNTYHHAKQELDILIRTSTDPDNRPIVEPFYDQILELCDEFGKSGQSGSSYGITASVLANTIKTLCMQEALCPLTGIDDEWGDVAEMNGGQPLWQNKRESAVFKDLTGVYYVDAIVFKGQNGNTFTSGGGVQGVSSCQYIKGFPFTPKTFYIDVISSQPEPDWWEHEIKDLKQLDKVWKYYENRLPQSGG